MNKINENGLLLEFNEKKVIGERIKQARTYRGKTQAQLAQELGITKQAISKYETNKSKLSTAVISKLPKILGFPLSFFTKEYKDEDKDKSIIYFRTKEIPKKTKDELKEKIIILDEEIIPYFEKHINFPKINLPNLIISDSFNYCDYSREDIKQIALQIRKHWKLDVNPIDNLAYIIQKNGYIINKQYINQNKTDGFSQLINNRAYILISANKECAVRSRFDLAHELGHLILHKNVDEEEQGSVYIERQADYFASEFIYPSDIFIEEIQELPLNFETFVMLKEKWKISMQAIVRKCKDLEIISDDKYIYFQKRISYNKWRTKEPLDDYIVPEEPRLLKDALELLIENERITKKDVLMDIDLDKDEIIKLCNLPEDYFEDSLQNVIKLY